MDYAYAELLTREKILKVLQERHVKVPGMETMHLSELQSIYKTFAMPLGRREKQPKKIRNIEKMDIDDNMEQTAAAIQITFSEKRPLDCNELNPYGEEYLSSATKRIKICSWP